MYVQEPGSSNGVFTHCIGCFKSADIYMLSHESHFFRSLTIGFILLNVLNTFLFDNTLLTNLNFIPLMLLATVFVQKLFKLYDACIDLIDFVKSHIKYGFNSKGVRSYENLMLEVAQRYVNSLKPYTPDPPLADESRNLPSYS